jgi:hypothetical protein
MSWSSFTVPEEIAAIALSQKKEEVYGILFPLYGHPSTFYAGVSILFSD